MSDNSCRVLQPFIIVRIKVIREKYPGGWEKCKRDYDCGIVWYDDHLFRYGSMDRGTIIEECAKWESLGFEAEAETEDGKKTWKDLCLYACLLDNNTACDWLAWNESGAYYNTKIMETLWVHGVLKSL
jgi:hypothetical protein